MSRPDANPLPLVDRRSFLRQAGGGFGAIALASLLSREQQSSTASAADVAERPLAPKASHFAPRAKRVIYLFMHGGPSHVDTFDYKPLLDRDHGKPLPFAKPRVVSSETGNLLKSPWKFSQHGQSGAWVS